MALANLAPDLARRDEPEDPVEALTDFPDGLTTAEVAAIMTPRNAPIDRVATEGCTDRSRGRGTRQPPRARRRRALARHVLGHLSGPGGASTVKTPAHTAEILLGIRK